MEKVFYYRKHMRILKKIIWIVAVLGAILAIIGLLLDDPFLRAFFIIFGLALIIEFFLINIFYKRFTTTRLVINNDLIHFSNNKKNIVLKYEDISHINTASISNFGGFFTIVGKNGEKIKLTVVIENIGEFILILREKLDELKLDVYNKDKLFSFYKTSCYSDDSWRRLYYAFPEILLYFALGIVLNYLSVVYYTGLISTINWIVVILALVIFTVIELGFYGRKIRKEADSITWEVTRFDLVKEKRFIKYLIRIPSIIIAITFITEILVTM